jgi:F420-dependent methylenetetrahydromethanopterin dehydrogenase
VYRSVIATALRMLRAHAKVETANLGELREEIERFDPQFVICTQPNTLDPGGILAWVELSLDRNRPTKVCVGGRYSERTALLGLEELLGIIDDAEIFVRTQKDRRGC